MKHYGILVLCAMAGCGSQDDADKAHAEERAAYATIDQLRKDDPSHATHFPSYIPPDNGHNHGTPVRTANTHDPMLPSAELNTSGAAAHHERYDSLREVGGRVPSLWHESDTLSEADMEAGREALEEREARDAADPWSRSSRATTTAFGGPARGENAGPYP
jgi:hypothetical protein